MDLISLILCILFVVLIILAIYVVILTSYRQYVLRQKLKNIPQYGNFPFGVALELMKLTNYGEEFYEKDVFMFF